MEFIIILSLFATIVLFPLYVVFFRKGIIEFINKKILLGLMYILFVFVLILANAMVVWSLLCVYNMM